MAMLNWPVVLLASAKEPTATLYRPLVSAVSALKPTAVLLIPPAPELTLPSALFPSAVFPPTAPSQKVGHCALSIGESANQTSAIASVKKPQRKDERLRDPIRVFIFLFISLNVALLNA